MRRQKTELRPIAKGGAGVGQRAFVAALAGGIQDADVMAAVAEIQAEGEPAADGSG